MLRCVYRGGYSQHRLNGALTMGIEAEARRAYERSEDLRIRRMQDEPVGPAIRKAVRPILEDVDLLPGNPKLHAPHRATSPLSLDRSWSGTGALLRYSEDAVELFVRVTGDGDDIAVHIYATGPCPHCGKNTVLAPEASSLAALGAALVDGTAVEAHPCRVAG